LLGQFQTRSAFCEFSDVIESFTAKEEDGLTSFLILDVLEEEIRLEGLAHSPPLLQLISSH